MRESIAKTKTCPLMLLGMKIGLLAVGSVPQITQKDYGDAIDATAQLGMERCIGSKCALWHDQSDMSDRYGTCGLVRK